MKRKSTALAFTVLLLTLFLLASCRIADDFPPTESNPALALPTAVNTASVDLMVQSNLTGQGNLTTTMDTAAIIQAVVATVAAQPPTGDVPESPELGQVVGETAVLDSDLEAAMIDIYKRVNPAVVSISILNSEGLPEGSGSGFVVDTDGHVVTNHHVVAGSGGLEVVFSNGERRSAEVVGSDIDSDLAVIKLDSLPEGVIPVQLGDSNNIAVGQFVVAIGNPFGEAGSMSVGIISGLGRSLSSQRIAEGGGQYSLPRVIQTDAAINPGNSGGPLLNLQGEVVGVNSAIRTSTGTNSGVGFSIPVNAVNRVVPVLISEGSYTYPFMGIRMAPIDLTTQERLSLPQTAGAYITDISAGTPAEAAGMLESGVDELNNPLPGGDLIIAVNGTPVGNPDDLISFLVFETEVGQTINLTVIRNGEEMTIPLTLGERP